MEANGNSFDLPTLEELRKAAESDHPDWEWFKVAASWRIVAAESIGEALEARYLLALAMYNLKEKGFATKLFELVLRRARLCGLWEVASNAGLQLALEYNETGNMPDRDRVLDDLAGIARCCGQTAVITFYRAAYGQIAHPNESSHY